VGRALCNLNCNTIVTVLKDKNIFPRFFLSTTRGQERRHTTRAVQLYKETVTLICRLTDMSMACPGFVSRELREGKGPILPRAVGDKAGEVNVGYCS